MLAFFKKNLKKTENIPGNMIIYHLQAAVAEQAEIAATMFTEEAVLLTEWVAPIDRMLNWYTLYLLPNKGLCCVHSILNINLPALIDLSDYFPVTARLQRAIYDLTRIPTKHAVDTRPWLNHGHFPLGVLNNTAAQRTTKTAAYTFKKVSGNGVHEIAVGPVHAGIIEPGHFRFSVVGERILKLEEHFGYTHKGTHQLFKNTSLEQASKLIGRISGDSTVAYAWAFAMACEHAARHQVEIALTLQRGIFLERERIINHLNDIGAIINDAAMPSLQVPFHLLKEQLLRQNVAFSQHRFLMDCIIPFNSKIVLSEENRKIMQKELNNLETEVRNLQEICEVQHGLQDRLQTTGILTTNQAKKLGVLGVTAKASGIDLDIRRLFAYAPYNSTIISACTTTAGDVFNRASVRFKEIFESIHLIKHMLEQLNNAKPAVLNPINSDLISGIGFGCVEGWRGPITVIVSIKNNVVEWCHFHDPSWQNWLAVEYAVMDNIVADFPLINKSFNLSYSGSDC